MEQEEYLPTTCTYISSVLAFREWNFNCFHSVQFSNFPAWAGHVPFRAEAAAASQREEDFSSGDVEMEDRGELHA